MGLFLDGHFSFSSFSVLELQRYQNSNSSDKLLVVYGLFNRKTFLLKDIVSCKKTKASFGRYWGVGVRYGSDGSEAYTTSFGNAVKVAPKTGRVFAFSSNKPNQVCEIIKRN